MRGVRAPSVAHDSHSARLPSFRRPSGVVDNAGSVVANERDCGHAGTDPAFVLRSALRHVCGVLLRVQHSRLHDPLGRESDVELDVFGYWLAVWTADLVALDLGSGAVRDVVALGSVLGDPRAHFELTGANLPFPLWFRLWTVCSDAEIRVYDRLRNEVRGFTLEGTELEAAALPPVTLTEVSARRFAEATLDMAAIELMGQVPPPGGRLGVSAADSARLLDGVVSELEASPAELANLLPRYVDLRCDDVGTLWIKPFDIDAHAGFAGGMKGGSLWLRIARDGESREVRMPDRFDPYRFTADRVWGVQRDELDVASVAWIELPPAR